MHRLRSRASIGWSPLMSKMAGICIAGMHRSGTSMVTEVLLRSGLWLGEESSLIPPAYSNEAGYWEHAAFVDLNESVLNGAGVTWDQIESLPAAHSKLWRQRTFIEQARKLVSTIGSDQQWGWKDPRNCLTLPFWLKILPSLKVVVCLRNPLEVAISLQRLGAVPSNAAGLRLWKSYNARLMQDAPPSKRIITHYSEYFSSPLAEIRRLASFAGLASPDSTANAALNAVRADLRHSHFGDKELADFGADVELIDLYRRMCEEAGWKQDEVLNGTVLASNPSRVGRRTSQPRVTAARSGLSLARQERDELRLKLDEQSAALALARERLSQAEDEADAARYDLDEIVGGSSGSGSADRREIRRIREAVRLEVPRDATVAVVSHGDENLLRLYGRRAWHFPQNDEGQHLERIPSSSTGAIAQLELIRALGANYLLI